MPILVGFHVEGGDYLILRSFLASLVGLQERDITPDCTGGTRGQGWQQVLAAVDTAIQRFYTKCAQLAIIGVDNDGNHDLVHKGSQEDPNRPRHWNHSPPTAGCRRCQLEALVLAARARLRPIEKKPPSTWPVLIAVPVEAIEAWILELQSIVTPSKGLARAEDRLRHKYKEALYGRPAAATQDVERIALPIIRSAAPAQLSQLRQRSKSFDDFAAQVDATRPVILGPTDCW